MTKKKIKILSLSLLGAVALVVPTVITAVSCANAGDGNNEDNLVKPQKDITLSHQNNLGFNLNTPATNQIGEIVNQDWVIKNKAVLLSGKLDNLDEPSEIIDLKSSVVSDTNGTKIEISFKIKAGAIFDKYGNPTETDSEELKIIISGFVQVDELRLTKTEFNSSDFGNLGNVDFSKIANDNLSNLNAKFIFDNKEAIFHGYLNSITEESISIADPTVLPNENKYDKISVQITIDKNAIYENGVTASSNFVNSIVIGDFKNASPVKLKITTPQSPSFLSLDPNKTPDQAASDYAKTYYQEQIFNKKSEILSGNLEKIEKKEDIIIKNTVKDSTDNTKLNVTFSLASGTWYKEGKLALEESPTFTISISGFQAVPLTTEKDFTDAIDTKQLNMINIGAVTVGYPYWIDYTTTNNVFTEENRVQFLAKWFLNQLGASSIWNHINKNKDFAKLSISEQEEYSKWPTFYFRMRNESQYQNMFKKIFGISTNWTDTMKGNPLLENIKSMKIIFSIVRTTNYQHNTQSDTNEAIESANNTASYHNGYKIVIQGIQYAFKQKPVWFKPNQESFTYKTIKGKNQHSKFYWAKDEPVFYGLNVQNKSSSKNLNH